MRLEPVQRVLQSLHAPHALIDAHALAARGYPRFTIDIAILTADPRVLDTGVWSVLQQEGATIDARRGDADDPLAGVRTSCWLTGRTSTFSWRSGSGRPR